MDVTCWPLLWDRDFPIKAEVMVAGGGEQGQEGALPEKAMTTSLDALCSLLL